MKSIFLTRCGLLLSSIAICCGFYGCVSDETTAETEPLANRSTEPPLPDGILELVPVGSRHFVFGKSHSMNFQLFNTGKAPLRLNEWRMHENENITFYIHPCIIMPDGSMPEYQEYLPHTQRKIVFVPLDLQPGNAVSIRAELPDLMPGEYILYAKLNTSRANVVTDPFSITIE